LEEKESGHQKIHTSSLNVEKGEERKGDGDLNELLESVYKGIFNFCQPRTLGVGLFVDFRRSLRPDSDLRSNLSAFVHVEVRKGMIIATELQLGLKGAGQRD
jgi:hypothetical protein